MAIAVAWIAVGIMIAAWSYRKDRPQQWGIGALFIALMWPLAFVGYAIELVTD